MKDNNNDWTDVLLNKYPHLELPFLEALIPETKLEVDGICKILKDHKILKGAKILDFSCGIGRHSIELAKRDFKVVGYDPSEFFIHYANRWRDKLNKRNKSNVQFVRGDPLKISKILSNHKKLDGAIMMGSPLGFLDENFDSLILRNIAKVLDVRYILIIEFENRDWTLKNFQSHNHFQSKNTEIYETWEFDSVILGF